MAELMFEYCILLHNRAMKDPRPLPESFCWTRFGAEAGQLIDAIVERKESERHRNGGTFLWGVGNAVGPSIRELVRRLPDPEVLFSPIKGRPRECDVAPESIVMWKVGETLDRRAYHLPKHSLVTSRAVQQCSKSSHYALVCFSAEPIQLIHEGPALAFSGLTNFLSGRPVGASQVTAVVTRAPSDAEPRTQYEIAFRAHLVDPYFIRLREPTQMTNIA